MQEMFTRTAMLLGEDAIERLKKARVAVFGIGGVGGYVTEALVRAGVGALDLIDNDVVCVLERIDIYFDMLRSIYNKFSVRYNMFNINWLNKNVEN